ncbi:hypothetical protein [Anaerotignum sp.]
MTKKCPCDILKKGSDSGIIKWELVGRLRGSTNTSTVNLIWIMPT